MHQFYIEPHHSFSLIFIDVPSETTPSHNLGVSTSKIPHVLGLYAALDSHHIVTARISFSPLNSTAPNTVRLTRVSSHSTVEDSVLEGMENVKLEQPGEDETTTSIHKSRFTGDQVPSRSFPDQEMYDVFPALCECP